MKTKEIITEIDGSQYKATIRRLNYFEKNKFLARYGKGKDKKISNVEANDYLEDLMRTCLVKVENEQGVIPLDEMEPEIGNWIVPDLIDFCGMISKKKVTGGTLKPLEKNTQST